MDTVKKYYFIAFSFLPLFQFVAQEFLHKNIVNLFGLIGVMIYFVHILKGDNLKYPKYLIPFILLIIYYAIWDFVNGDIKEIGLFTYFYRNSWLYSLVLLILIENTSFDKQFIDRIIIIFKGTIVVAFVVVLFQLIIDPFFLMPDASPHYS